MEIRVLKLEEHLLYTGICKLVFFDIERSDVLAELKNPLEHAYDDEKKRYGVFREKGKLLWAAQIIPYEMRLNGSDVKVGGIGGVVTLPEARGFGYIRRLMEKMFEEMIDAGQVYSFLFPFSYTFYRKFGYEICHQKRLIRIPISEFGGFGYPKNLEAYTNGDSYKPFAEIYETFVKDRNFALKRDKKTWGELLDRDPYKRLEFTYLHYTNKNADAYIMYNVAEQSEDGSVMKITELCWKTPEALRGIFGFISKMGAEFEAVEWLAPDDINPNMLFPEAFNHDWKETPGGMLRILDANAALNNLTAPNLSGKINIKITDAFCEKNNAVYAVEWQNGCLTAAKTQKKEPDISISIETLAQFISGYITPQQAAFKNGASINNKLTELSALFPRKSAFITEHF